LPPSTDAEDISGAAFYINGVDCAELPPGWIMDEEGYFQMSEKMHDFWEVKAGCLIRHHVKPRRGLFSVSECTDLPIDPQVLDPIRITLKYGPDGTIETIKDNGTENHFAKKAWLGLTICEKGDGHVCQCTSS